ncbi:tRNA-splicing endonuclease [Xylona heveae TC161]|uniref:tRNA-splicing endonuclease n=1 Tax=Xylona heveae (strain CBS 132557 / TC161) TaxID=1328760 RepID=A0A165FCK1_XYLHT|nr:tRNA-splicing endonuclease [Xylona heveae TC161]KZF20824.1 tRNA-splicing endonuclease [Xylona heveae TC161]
MAELVAGVESLQALPDEVHWFCERRGDDGEDPNETNFEQQNGNAIDRAREAEQRRGAVFMSLQLLAYDGEGIQHYQQYLRDGLDRQMVRCDTCIREYHKGKKQMMERLRHDYDDQDVLQFCKIFDDKDIQRIKAGLTSALSSLLATPPEKRGPGALHPTAMHAIFESLSCEAFLTDDDLLQSYFDEPFRLMQVKRTLKLGYCVPAMTCFLFDPQPFRLQWAVNSWSKFTRNITSDEFDWAVREQLIRVLTRAAGPEIDINLIKRLWDGMKLVVNKLDKDLITHSLRAMDIDVCRMALEHLQFDTPGFHSLLQTIVLLLEKSPEDFWDSMGAISPSTVVEQIFTNPYLVRTLRQDSGDHLAVTPAVNDMLAWIEPFMASLKPANQPPACRSIVLQLIDRLQTDQFPESSRIYCYQKGVQVLVQTLSNFNEDQSVFGSVGRIVVSDTLEVASTYVGGILTVARSSSHVGQNVASACMDVVRNALSLECRALKADHEILEAEQALQHGGSSHSNVIWDAVVKNLESDNMPLAKAALRAVMPLVGLEKFNLRTEQTLVKEKSRFNDTFSHLTHWVFRILEKLNDFDPDDLDELFKNKETASTLISALFSADENTYHAALELIKTVSAQFGRKEAIAHLLKSFFDVTMSCLAWAIRRIANKGTFASVPRMLKTCTDVIDILCNLQDGLLRSKTLNGAEEVTSVEMFWQYQWQALRVIFERTESWSQRGNDKSVMMEFCRDTMEFAERLFEQYSAFSSAIDSADSIERDQAKGSGEKNAGRKLLEHPVLTLNSMAKWLRLRDEYLANTLVALLTKILGRLADWGMTIGDDTYAYIDGGIIGGSVRNVLPLQSKAELSRALEGHHGPQRPSTKDTKSVPAQSKRQSTLAGWAQPGVAPSVTGPRGPRQEALNLEAWRAKAKSPRDVIDISDEDEYGGSSTLNDDILDLSKSVEKARPLLQKFKDQPARVPALRAPSRDADGLTFRERREKEKEAKKRRDLAELARVKKNLPPTGVAEQTSEEGSGLRGIGVRGKDHAPQGSIMMVPSDSESDSEMDEMDAELFGKAPKSSSAVKDYERSKADALKQMERQGPVKKKRQVRSAKDMRARLAPDLSPLHKTILSWDFFAEGDFPPSSDRHDYSLVSNTFRTPIDYQRVFEPLLVLEAWQGFLKAREEGNFKPFEIKVANRLSVDSFIEVSTTVSVADGKDLGIGEADIILMSKAKSPTQGHDQPHCLARVFRVTRKKNIIEISYRVVPGNPLISSLAPNVTLWGVKISSITPLEREYGALLGLQYYDLCDEIIRAKPSPLLNYTEKQLKSIFDIYGLNLAQAKAVRSAVDNDAFTLIQGPPGSGKTKTIVAIAGALLTTSLEEKGVAISRPQFNNGLNLPGPRGGAPARKLLVCAPSNAAVDELVMRLKEPVKTLNGEPKPLRVVRIGRSDAINANVMDVTLEELVNAKLNLANGNKNNPGDEIHKIMMEHKATSDELNVVRTILDEARAKGEQAAEQQRNFELLKRKKAMLSTQLDNARDRGNTAARDAEINRRRVQQEILDQADVICATLSGSGHDMFQNLNIEFETVIIDEAAQSIELSALIPLKYGCSKCILVGDPKQLPPTVLSREAARFQYEQSLFVRMQGNHPNDVHLLDTQYRMHPDISRYPSKAFYDGKLLDGPGMDQLRQKPWHASGVLGPYRFFDVQGQHQSAPKGHSLINVAELNIALMLFDRLITDFRGYDFKGKVGIITPYKSQLRELKTRFAAKYGESILSSVDFNTTDAYQGRESEVIIFSCVRASSSRGIGFLADIRRMNVGLTRAKCSLWVLGNSQSLVHGEFWAGLITDAQSRGLYTSGDLKKMLARPSASGETLNYSNGFGGDSDIEMPDAPTAGSATPSEPEFPVQPPAPQRRDSKKSSEATTAKPPAPKKKKKSADMGTTNAPQKALSAPSGALLNPADKKITLGTSGTSTPGSKSHDESAQTDAGTSHCFRCGDTSHTRIHCKAVRCLQCGAFGHVTNTCPNPNALPARDRKRLQDKEDAHYRKQQEFQDKQRARQLGEHDSKIPSINVTRRTPPLEDGLPKKPPVAPKGFGKRPREPSPPTDLPAVKPGDVKSKSRIENTPQNLPSKPVPAGTHPLPPRPVSSAPEPAPDPGQNRPMPNPIRGPPPPKRRKEVDPFIRPKKRGPRP